jgi:hypothetical protein
MRELDVDCEFRIWRSFVGVSGFLRVLEKRWDV